MRISERSDASVDPSRLRPLGPAAADKLAPILTLLLSRASTPRLFRTRKTTSVDSPPS
jgi:hypothetical protein